MSSEAGNSLLARFYFMAFYIVTLVIIQVFVAYIVDEFKFKLAECTGNCPKHNVPLEYCLCARELNIPTNFIDNNYFCHNDKRDT